MLTVGRIIIPLVSFGRWKFDKSGSVPKGILPMGFFVRRGEYLYVTDSGAVLCGFLGIIALILVASLFHALFSVR
jgi:hypothetical protein